MQRVIIHRMQLFFEYILTTAYDISTATVNNTKIVHRGSGKNAIVPTQVVFNNDGTKMFIANHLGMNKY